MQRDAFYVFFLGKVWLNARNCLHNFVQDFLGSQWNQNWIYLIEKKESCSRDEIDEDWKCGWKRCG